MAFDKSKKHDEEREQIQMPTLNALELKNFEEWINTFKTVEEAMVDYGALAKIEHLGKQTTAVHLDVVEGKYRNIESYKRPSKYELFWNAYDQWQKSVWRREFAQSKATEEYQKIADELVESTKFKVPPIPYGENEERATEEIEKDVPFDYEESGKVL